MRAHPAILRLLRTLLVRDTEVAVLAHFVTFFLLSGAGIALGRGSADALFLKRFGIEYLPLMYICLSILLALTGLLYAAWADRAPAERLFQRIFLSVCLILALQWALMRFGETQWVYPFYFLTYEAVSELLLVHGALYMSQNLDTRQSKRLVPLVIGGTQLGAMAGGLVLASSASHIGLENSLLFWLVLLAAAMLVLRRWHRRYGMSPHYRGQSRSNRGIEQSVRQISQTLQLTRSSELLRAVSLALFFMVVTFYILSYGVNRIYTVQFSDETALAGFFGLLTALTGAAALLLQVFVSNRAIDRFGVQRINLVFPVCTAISFAALLGHFGFLSALLGSVNKDVVMPAFRKPVRAIIYNALPGNVQGRARAMSVVLVIPVALMTCGALLWAMQYFTNPVYFLWPGLGCALLYLYFSLRMNRAYNRALIDHLHDHLLLPDESPEQSLRGTGRAGLESLVSGLQNTDEAVAVSFARSIAAGFPELAPDLLIKRLKTASPGFCDQVFRLLDDCEPDMARIPVQDLFTNGDDHLKATLLRFLGNRKYDHMETLTTTALNHPNARVRAAGIEVALGYPLPSLSARARHEWRLLFAETPAISINAFEPLACSACLPDPARKDIEALAIGCMGRFIDEPDTGLVMRATRTARSWPFEPQARFGELLGRLSRQGDFRHRLTAYRSLALVPVKDRPPLVRKGLNDPHPRVRNAAVDALLADSTDPVTTLAGLLSDDNRIPPRGQHTLLDALNRFDIEVEKLLAIARSRAELATRLDAAIAVLEQSPDRQRTGPALLLETLGERCRALVDLSLQALQPAGNPRDIATIRAAVRSGDKRYIANACEALSNAAFPEVCQLLAEITDTFLGSGRKQGPDERFRGIDDVIEWCESCGDPWLQTCARQARIDLVNGAST